MQEDEIALTDKEIRLSLSVQNYTDLMHDEHCADLLRELYFICSSDTLPCSANRPRYFPRSM